MVLGYRSARVVSLVLPYGAPVTGIVLWVLSDFNPLYFALGIAWFVGFSIWVAVRYGTGDLRFGSLLYNDLMDDLTGAKARRRGDVTASEIKYDLRPSEEAEEPLR